MTTDILSTRTSLDAQFDVSRTLREDQVVPDSELQARLLRKFQKNLKLDANGAARMGLWRLGIDVTPSGKGRVLRMWGYLPFGNIVSALLLILAAFTWFSFYGMTGVSALRWLEGLNESQFQQKINLMHVLSRQEDIDAYFRKGRIILLFMQWVVPIALVAFSLLIAYAPQFRANRAIDALMREL